MRDFTIDRLIYNVLIKSEESRDDWMLTISEIHSMEMKIQGIDKKDYFEALFTDRRLSNVHTLKRRWQKIQEDYPELRGKTWEERQKQGGQYVEPNFDPAQMKLFDFNELQ